MNLSPVDWIIAVIGLALITLSNVYCKRFIKGVAQFVVAGRNIRKYLALSSGMGQGLALISIANICQQGFTRGLCLLWIGLIASIVSIVVFGIFGFGIVRYRQLKIMTMPQFFEMRYSKGVRLLVGCVAAIAGILNLAIFPIVGAKFLKYFLGAPESLELLGQPMDTVYVLIAILLGLACLFAYLGGMISIFLTNYIQMLLIAVVLFGTTFVMIHQIGFSKIHETLITKFGESAFNPFMEGGYGFSWMLYITLAPIPAFLSWAPNMQRVASFDGPKTAKIFVCLSGILSQGMTVFMLIWGISALTTIGPDVQEGFTDYEEYTRYASASFLGKTMPLVIKGIAVTAMVTAFITTVNSDILTWASILVNDIICTIKKKPMSPRAHLWTLRLMVALITLFLFFFATIYKPTESILSYIIITGAMILGTGIAIIGGLYWKRATTRAAYVAVSVSCVIPLIDVIAKQIVGTRYELESPTVGLISLFTSVVVFVLVSLFTRRTDRAVGSF